MIIAQYSMIIYNINITIQSCIYLYTYIIQIHMNINIILHYRVYIYIYILHVVCSPTWRTYVNVKPLHSDWRGVSSFSGCYNNMCLWHPTFIPQYWFTGPFLVFLIHLLLPSASPCFLVAIPSLFVISWWQICLVHRTLHPNENKRCHFHPKKIKKNMFEFPNHVCFSSIVLAWVVRVDQAKNLLA